MMTFFFVKGGVYVPLSSYNRLLSPKQFIRRPREGLHGANSPYWPYYSVKDVPGVLTYYMIKISNYITEPNQTRKS